MKQNEMLESFNTKTTNDLFIIVRRTNEAQICLKFPSLLFSALLGSIHTASLYNDAYRPTRSNNESKFCFSS
jgi:hypothetical protein